MASVDETMAAEHTLEAKRLDFLNALNNGGGVVEAAAYLRSGGDINAAIVPLIEQTMLHYAAIYRNGSLIEFLAQHGANINSTNAHGMTALHLAVMHEIDAVMLKKQEIDFPIARHLVGFGALLDVSDNQGRTPRAYAELYGQSIADLFDEAVK